MKTRTRPTEPYLEMSGSIGVWRSPTVWVEFPAATTHAALVDVAERLARDFGAVVTGRFPEDADDDSKEYWWLRHGSAKLMLMRKPPHMPVGLYVQSGGVEVLVRIGRAWEITRYVGWRWRIWRAFHRPATHGDD